MMYLFPALRAFWFLEKTALRENRVGWTVLYDSTNAELPHLRVHSPKIA